MSLFFFWLAILPSILLARNVLKYDRIEREPTGLLVRLFVGGMLSCIHAWRTGPSMTPLSAPLSQWSHQRTTSWR